MPLTTPESTTMPALHRGLARHGMLTTMHGGTMRRRDNFYRFMAWLFIGYLLVLGVTAVVDYIEKPPAKTACMECITL